MYEWVLFVHIASILAFMLAHGVYVNAMWAMRGEADPEQMLTFFNIVPPVTMLRVILAVVVLSGGVAGFMGDWWGSAWIWISLGLLVVISVLMWLWGGPYFGDLQQAAEAAIAARGEPDNTTAQAAYDTVRHGWRVPAVSVVGLGGTAVILWLMMFKPF